MVESKLDLEYLSMLRAKSGMTLQEISDKSGWPPSTLSRLFSGATPNPGIVSVTDLVRVLGGSVDVLMGLKAGEDDVIIAVETNRERVELPEHAHAVLDSVYRRALESSRESYNNSFNKLAEEYEHFIRSHDREMEFTMKIIDDKSRWIRLLFCYCVGITVVVVIGLLLMLYMHAAR